MKLSSLLAGGLATALLAGAVPRTAHAAWPHDPNAGNVGICTAVGNQSAPRIISDGAGGAILTWMDQRGGFFDVYAQRVSAAGVPLWTTNGVAVCNAVNDQLYPTIAPDGAGGAIITWYDLRSGATYDIYAQRVTATGAIAGGWPANGVALCTAASHQHTPTITSDGAGGAIVVWQDGRSGGAYDIYAQRVNGAGATQWAANGVAICTAAGDQLYPNLTSDGANGAILTWYDFRGADTDIYALRITAGGAIAAGWPVNGLTLCNAPSDQYSPVIASDGVGGAIVTWYDYRAGNGDVYAQRVSPGGSQLWLGNGVAVCTAAGEQAYPAIVSDGVGGAFVTWHDARSGVNYDIYAQRVAASGAIAAGWPVNGVALAAATDNQLYPTTCSDGTGGAIVAWYDFRGGSYPDIYAQRVSAAGATQWPANGVAISTAVQDQSYPVIAADGSGGAIAAWPDYRNVNLDVYAQRVEHFGQLGNPEPVISSVRDVANDQGGKVNVTWFPSWLDTDPGQLADHYWILRALSHTVAQAPSTKALPLAVAAESGAPPRPGAVLTTTQGANTYFWEYLATVSALHIVDGYGYVAPTTGDSTGSGNPRTYFMVVAWNVYGTQYWSSAPDSGYSVDNLGPATPAPFTGQYNAGNTALHWNPNSEADLAGYRLYRGTTAGFIPGPGNLVVAQSDTGFVDVAGAPYYYKLTAVDLHGNESPPALLLPSGTTDVPSGGLGEIAFAAPAPNPARTGVVLRIALPREARVSLAVYDVNGARVRTLLAGSRTAGEHPVAWDLRSERGARVPAGLYFARLEAEGRTWTRRIATLE